MKESRGMCIFYQILFKYIAKKGARCYLSVSEFDEGFKDDVKSQAYSL